MPSNKRPVLALGLSILALAALAALIWFLYQKIERVSAVIAEAELKMARLEKKEREFSSAKSDLKDYEQEIESLDGAFLSEGTFVDFLRLLESLSKKTGVVFAAKTAQLPSSQGKEAILSFELAGSFSSIVNFLALLDKIPYAGLVESINIAPKIEPDKKLTGFATAKVNYLIFNFDL